MTSFMDESLLNAEIHRFRDANHGDGQEHVVADFDSLTGSNLKLYISLKKTVIQQILTIFNSGLLLSD
jgi:hypothetical protein